MATYIDGLFKLDYGTIDNNTTSYIKTFRYDASTIEGDLLYLSKVYSNTPINIKQFKERVKGIVKKEDKFVLLVRFIEDDKVTYVKYR